MADTNIQILNTNIIQDKPGKSQKISRQKALAELSEPECSIDFTIGDDESTLIEVHTPFWPDFAINLKSILDLQISSLLEAVCFAYWAAAGTGSLWANSARLVGGGTRGATAP